MIQRKNISHLAIESCNSFQEQKHIDPTVENSSSVVPIEGRQTKITKEQTETRDS